MIDSHEQLEKAELRYQQAQAALDEVGKVLAAVEQAQAAADHARQAADRAHEAVRKLLPVVAAGFAVVILLSLRRHHSRSQG